ncbi:MAG TPA: glycogen synthase GlgA [bacterium]|nr:glycogen synthase GlgA [bacterium]
MNQIKTSLKKEAPQESSRRQDNSTKPKILLVASEVHPFAKTGGLADVAGALPHALLKLGCEVAVVMPKYKSVSPEKYRLKYEINGLSVPMGMGDMSADILSTRLGDTYAKIYFVQCDRYFDREGLYGTPEGDYHDNAERFAFFSRSVLEMLRALDWYPDVIHLNDWQTGLIPAYLKTLYADQKNYQRIRTLFTIHNMAYQGLFPKYVLPMTGLRWEEYKQEKLEFYDQVNYLKAGLVYSDVISTVSPTYAAEIKTDEFGQGLQGVLNTRAEDLRGILNGIDYDEWNPATDKEIPAQYTVKNHDRKIESKMKLLNEQGLDFKAQTPVIGLVSRLTDQKGLDLISEIIEPFLAMDAQLVVLGTGDARYHEMFEMLQRRFPQKLAVNLKYDHRLAKLIYAGSDMFLMPSRFEPCGLGQMIAMKYGSIPLVRKTGGLSDTVENLSSEGKKGTGFVFENYRSEELLFIIRRAVEAFRQPKIWKELVQRAMTKDFSWDASARQYLDLYGHIQRK